MKNKLRGLLIITFILIISFFHIKCPPPTAIYQVTGNKDIIIGTTMKRLLICDANDLKLISFFKDKLSPLPIFVIEKKIYYLTGWKRQLSILDISNPQNPYLVEPTKCYKNIDMGNIMNHYIYLATKNHLIIIDLQNMDDVLGEYKAKSLNSIEQIVTDEKNHLCLAGRKKIEIVDISNVANPCYIHTYEMPYDIGGIKVYNGLLYIRYYENGNFYIETFSFNGAKGLASINVDSYSYEDIINLHSFKDPILLELYFIVKLRPYFGALFISDDYLYISKGGRIDKMNITDPYAPRLVASYVNVDE